MRRLARIVGGAVLIGATAMDPVALLLDGTPAPSARALVGRPATPLSFAGVARRTTRRQIRRTSVYAATLPAGCAPVVVEGTALYRCGGVYYQQAGGQYAVVEIH